MLEHFWVHFGKVLEAKISQVKVRRGLEVVLERCCKTVGFLRRKKAAGSHAETGRQPGGPLVEPYLYSISKLEQIVF